MNANSRRSDAETGLSAGEKRATRAILYIKSETMDNAILSFVFIVKQAVRIMLIMLA
jgi:hypothetical protein